MLSFRPAGSAAPAPADAAVRPSPIRRRSFFKYAGAAAGVTALALAGCHKDDSASPALLDVGSGNLGVLNYAYALEQLEAAFYAQVIVGAYYTALPTTSGEYQTLSDLALHERIHVDYLRNSLALLITSLGAGSLLPPLTPDFSTISFSDRTTVPGSGRLGVLNAAQMFEDLGVAAYNGVARFITTAEYLTLTGKIVSVEARHAALLRDMLLADGVTSLGNGFVGADVVDSSTTSATARMEKSMLPAAVLPKLNVFLAAGSKLMAPSLA